MKTKAFLMFVLVVALSTFVGINSANAQPDSPPSDGDAPIDGGLIALVIAGSTIGAKKLFRKQI